MLISATYESPLAGTGNTYYVATTGSDQNNGLTRTSPWRTIQHAAGTMLPGDTAIVLAGTYSERVKVTKSGASGTPITFEADSGATVAMQGFQITASYIQVIAFDISNHNRSEPSGFGIYLVGSNNLIAQNYIHDLCMEGVMVSGNGNRNSAGTAHNQIANNRIVHAEMAGGHIEGQQNVIQGNDVSHTAQYPAGCPSRSGADADGFRFFGSGHDFLGNSIHDIPWGTTENPNPHTDCFQTWGPASNMTFEQNLCVWPAATDTTRNETASIESSGGVTTGLTFKNNLFANMLQGLNVSNSSGMIVLNNTFDRILQEAVILKGAPNSAIENNIFYDVGSGTDSYACIDSASQSGTVVMSNDHYMPSGSPGTYCSNAPHLTLDPQFIDVADHDFRLKSSSPMIDAGTTLSSVTNDYYGEKRPQSNGYDIGATEYPQ